MKHLTVLLTLLVCTCAANDTDWLNISAGMRPMGLTTLSPNVRDDLKYTRPHAEDVHATRGGYHSDPDLYVYYASFFLGIDARLTSRAFLRLGNAMAFFYGSDYSEKAYSASSYYYRSYTYLSAEIDDKWAMEPFVEAMLLCGEDNDSPRVSLGYSRMHDISIRYERGWYRYDDHQAAMSYKADVESETYYMQLTFLDYEGVELLLRLEHRQWEAKSYDSESEDESTGFVFGLAYSW